MPKPFHQTLGLQDGLLYRQAAGAFVAITLEELEPLRRRFSLALSGLGGEHRVRTHCNYLLSHHHWEEG